MHSGGCTALRTTPGLRGARCGCRSPDAVSLDKAVRDRAMPVHIDVAKLLVELGLKDSRTDAERQVTAGVGIDGVTSTSKVIKVEERPARIAIRVGKRAKIAVIN